MALEQERTIGIRGLNLGVDASDAAPGSLLVADGARALELGSVSSKGGRVKAGLDFPDEGISGAAFHEEHIDHFHAGIRTRGFAAYYDQRIWPTDSSGNTVNIPQRLNYLWSDGAAINFNYHWVGSGDGIVSGITGYPTDARAKFVVYGLRAYVVQEGNLNRVFQRKPVADQTYLNRIKYEVTRMGIRWPTAGSSLAADTAQKPTITTATGAAPLPAGTYRFRIVLENRYGVQSGPSVFAQQIQTSGGTINKITVKWDTISTTFPSDVTKVRLYVQFTALDTPADTASAYLYVNNKAVADGAVGIDYTLGDHQDAANRPIMRTGNGCPPRLRDLCIVNDIAYGAAAPDVIYREVIESELVAASGLRTDWNPGGENRGSGAGLRNNRANVKYSKLSSAIAVKPTHVNESFLFVSEPGEPEYMETWYQVGNGTEIIVGLAPIGTNCAIFTNQRIYIFDPEAEVLRTVPASVGCLARDTIVLTERGIRFVGTDGVPRLFNGATVEESADELLPIFDREDYVGEYQRFDKTNAQEVIGTWGDRKFWMLYPVSNDQTIGKPLPPSDPGLTRHLAIGDESRKGPTFWTIDRSPNYELIYWLGRESRLLAIDHAGDFYFIEEGSVLEWATGLPTNPDFEIWTRRFSLNGRQGQFYAISIEANTQAQVLRLSCKVDGHDDQQWETTFSTGGREEFRRPLPSNFKGRYIDVKIIGQPATRVTIYGIIVELAVRGEFS